MIRALLAPFRRITSSGRFIPEIDGLRFVAITSVLLYHIASYTGRKVGMTPETETTLAAYLKTGWIGVPLFFVISGFILALPFAVWRLRGGQRVNLKAYFLRRLTRLEPPFLASFLLVAPVVILAGSVPDFGRHLLATVFYLHSLIFGKFSTINNVTWSLEIEVQFYTLAPLFALMFVPRSAVVRRGLLAVLMVTGALASRLVLDPDGRLTLTLLGYSQYFFAGFLLADIYVADWDSKPEPARVWDVVSLVGWPALFVAVRWMAQDKTLDLIRAVFMPGLIVLLYVAVFRGVWSRWLLSRPLLTVIGGMCYSIYLLHNTLIPLAFRASKHLLVGHSFGVNFLIQTLVMVPVILIVSSVFFVLIERPCMDRRWPAKLRNYLRELFTHKKPTPVVEAGA